MPAPVTLFVYNRPDKTQSTLQALKKNELASQSDLFIYSDGPKTDNDLQKVREVREIINNVEGFKSVLVHEKKKNEGLANSIIKGVTEIVNKYGRVIVLEDDIQTSPYFLKFMNDALNLYEKEEKVISIHGYNYPVKAKLPEYFFLRGADCWGWATWKRGWDLFEPDGKKLLKELVEQKMTYTFDFNGSYPFTQMLKDQIEGKTDSWAIRWNASAFLKNKYTLYPGKTLVFNSGTDGSGVHCLPTESYNSELNLNKINLRKIPVEENVQARIAIAEFFKPSGQSFIRKIIRKIIRKFYPYS